jgi:phage-related protein
VFYVARLKHAIYVLHVFRNKSRKISKADIDLAKTRFHEALRMEGQKK